MSKRIQHICAAAGNQTNNGRLKNEDDPKNEAKPKYQEDSKNEDNPKKEDKYKYKDDPKNEYDGPKNEDCTTN